MADPSASSDDASPPVVSSTKNFAAMLESMINSDDPFGNKKKQTTTAFTEDAPIATSAATKVQLYDDPPSTSITDSPDTVSTVIATKKRPVIKGRSRLLVTVNKENNNSNNSHTSTDKDSSEEMKESFPSARAPPPHPSSSIGGMADETNTLAVLIERPTTGHTEDQESKQEDSDPVSIPSSATSASARAAALSALLNSDDPFGSKKKTAFGEDQPIGGNRQTQLALLSTTSMNGMEEEQQSSNDHEKPLPLHRRDDKQQTEHDASADDGCSSSGTTLTSSRSSPPPRRPPIRTAKQTQTAAKADAGTTNVGNKKAGAAAPNTSTSGHSSSTGVSTPKAETFHGDALMDNEAATQEMSAVVDSSIITGLTSKKWNEQVDALTRLTTAAESGGADNFVPHLPALLSLLHNTPSFKAANFNVCRAVYVCYSSCLSLYLQSSSTSFSPALAYHPLNDLLSKLSDAKLVESIHHLLSIMAECAGPKFLLSHVLSVINAPAFKNQKAIESAIGWINTLLQLFGIATVDVLGLIDICHSVWLQSIQKGVRDATLQLFVTIYQQSGNLFKEKMINTLKPTTAKELEALFAAVPAETVGKVSATKHKKGETGPATLNVDALMPRVDLSVSITDKLPKKLNDDNWKERKEAMDEVESLIKAANSRITSKDGGVLEIIGKWRLVDKNKNLSRDALALVALFVEAMGKPITAYRDKLVPNMFVCLADSKKLVKDEALKTVGVWVETAGLASVAKYLPKALSVPGSRKELLDIMLLSMSDASKMKKEKKDMDMDELIPPIISCIQDKTGEVRAVAEKVCECLMQYVGFDSISEYTKNLKKADLLKIAPVLEKMKKDIESSSNTEKHKDRDKDNQQKQQTQTHGTEVEDEGQEEKKPRKAGVGVASRTGTLKGKSSSAASQPTGGKSSKGEEGDTSLSVASGSVSSGVSNVSCVSDSSSLIRRVDLAAKNIRVKKDAKRVKGSFREWGTDEIEELQEKMRELVSDALFAQLFHKDFSKQIIAIESLDEYMHTQLDAVISILDLILKWSSWRVCDANTTVLVKILAFIISLFNLLSTTGYTLHEGEANNLLPFLVEKVLGHKTDRFTVDAKEIFRVTCLIYDEHALFSIVNGGLDSKNKRVQAEAIDYCGKLILQYGLTVGDTKKLIVSVALAVGTSDAGVRAAALNTLGQIYEKIGEQIYTLMGIGKGNKGTTGPANIPQKQIDMIEERFKRIKPSNSQAGEQVEDTHHNNRSTTTTNKTPKRVSPPSSVPASPIPSLAPGINSNQTGRTPVKGMLPTSSSASAVNRDRLSMQQARPASANAHLGNEEDRDDPASSMSFSGYSHPAFPRPSSRNSFSTPISADLPDCFSLDLDTDQTPTRSNNITDSSDTGHTGNELHTNVRNTAQAHILPASQGMRTDFSTTGNTRRSIGPTYRNTQTATALTGPTTSVNSAGLSAPVSVCPPLASYPLRPVSSSSLLPDLSLCLSDEDRIELMKQLWDKIMKSAAEVVRGQTDSIVSFLVDQIQLSFKEHRDEAGHATIIINHRYCRYALNTLMELFKLPDLIQEVTVTTLSHVTSLLLCKLMDERLKNSTADQQSKQLMQAINVLVLKVMENSDRTAILHVLLTFAKHIPIQAQQQQLQQEASTGSSASSSPFLDLVVRCLSKLIKTFQSTGLENIDLIQLLYDIDSYLQHISNTMNPASLDSPDPIFRAVRSLLMLIVQVVGEKIRDDIQSFSADRLLVQLVEKTITQWKTKQQQSHMPGTGQYTNLVSNIRQQRQQQQQQQQQYKKLNTDNNSRTQNSIMQTQTHIQTQPSTVTYYYQGEKNNTQREQADKQDTLQDLASLVCQPLTTKEGIRRLVEYSQLHPHINVMDAFTTQSESFKAYVQRQLVLPKQQQIQQSHNYTMNVATTANTATTNNTEQLRQRLQLIQSKAKETNSAARQSIGENTNPAAAASGPALNNRHSIPMQMHLHNHVSTHPTASVLPCTAASTSSSSLDSIKQRFAAVNSQRLSSAPQQQHE